jgi:isopentenyl-diphosphate delta-isomerase
MQPFCCFFYLCLKNKYTKCLNQKIHIENIETAASRKQDHIELALKSQIGTNELDKRFSYEPLFAAHPSEKLAPFSFLGKIVQTPIWVSSMTGGTEKANKINKNLALVCQKFGMGMGLGSCRSILDGNERLPDFDLRNIIGDDLPFYANLGIAQLENILENNAYDKIDNLIHKLKADGLIIHVNPFQEWLQPEGDVLKNPPIETIQKLLEITDLSIIVKEVGQGFGKESLKALIQLPIDAIEFAAAGGTNFSKLELFRQNNNLPNYFDDLTRIGHSAKEMVENTNLLLTELGESALCNQFIVSGGVRNFLDGYFLTKKLYSNAVFGMASGLLFYADKSYEALEQFVAAQIEGLN